MRPVDQNVRVNRLTQMFYAHACAADFMLIADNSVRSGSRNVDLIRIKTFGSK